MKWSCRERIYEITHAPILVGILNVTPDSFSDGGQYTSVDHATNRADIMLAEGADIIDIGGESTRPGAMPVSTEEECDRVIPVIASIKKKHPQCVISVDTTKADVAEQALGAGASIINDISSCEQDIRMMELIANTGAGVILMHKQGTPQSMQVAPHYENVISEVYRYLEQRIKALQTAGVNTDQIAVDPGFGFGKTLEHNLLLLRKLSEFTKLNRPVMAAFSRKSMFGQITGQSTDNRLAASLAGLCYAVLQGCHLLRVHDVKASRDAMCVLTKIQETAEISCS